MNTFKTKGVCSRQITFDIQEGTVKDIDFMGGCPGNLKAIANLVTGMPVDDVIKRLKGITCDVKPTSCADQLAIALEQYKQKS